MTRWEQAFAVATIAATLAGCASTAAPSRQAVTIGEGVQVSVPAGFRVRAVTGMGGEGIEIRRYRRGRETGDLCIFRLARQASPADPETFAAALVEQQLASSGVRDAASGAEVASSGRPGRRYVTASFSLHSTIHTDDSYWVWRAGPDLVVVSRSCQSDAGAGARQAVADALSPVFTGAPDA